MAKDVHQAIVHVLEKEGGLTEEESENYLAELKKTNAINVTFINIQGDSPRWRK